MSLNPSERRVLLDRLAEEHALAPPAMTASNVADQYDTPMALLLATGDREVLRWAIAHADDPTPVRTARPPHDQVEGGYGKMFGPLTVGDKARFLLTRWLGRKRAAAAIAAGPAWVDGQALRWDARSARFLG